MGIEFSPIRDQERERIERLKMVMCSKCGRYFERHRVNKKEVCYLCMDAFDYIADSDSNAD